MPGPLVHPAMLGWQCCRDFVPQTICKGGHGVIFIIFFLFILTACFTTGENWFLAGPAMCMAGSRAGEGFLPSLSIFETEMGGEEEARSRMQGAVG